MEHRLYGLSVDHLEESDFYVDDETGKVRVRVTGALERTVDGLHVRVDNDTLVETASSPVALRAQVSVQKLKHIETMVASTRGGGGPPTGPAGGDLSGTYPNPTVDNAGMLDGLDSTAFRQRSEPFPFMTTLHAPPAYVTQLSYPSADTFFLGSTAHIVAVPRLGGFNTIRLIVNFVGDHAGEQLALRCFDTGSQNGAFEPGVVGDYVPIGEGATDIIADLSRPGAWIADSGATPIDAALDTGNLFLLALVMSGGNGTTDTVQFGNIQVVVET